MDRHSFMRVPPAPRELQRDRIAKVHRSDVIKEVLAEKFGPDLKEIEGD